ncbi:MAG: Ig-like domain repeat protein, partial [Methanosphaera sp.]|nr:Ig-like domain repeat protein [Methanosphaera sp.]
DSTLSNNTHNSICPDGGALTIKNNKFIANYDECLYNGYNKNVTNNTFVDQMSITDTSITAKNNTIFISESIIDQNEELVTKDIKVTVKLDGKTIISQQTMKKADLKFNFTAPNTRGLCNLTIIVHNTSSYFGTEKTIKLLLPTTVYASSNGRGSGTTVNDPTNITNALQMINNGYKIILVSNKTSDTYNNDITIHSGTVKEGTDNFTIESQNNKTITIKGQLSVTGKTLTLNNIIFDGKNKNNTKLLNNAKLTINNCTFKNHQSNKGAAIYNYANLTITNSKFSYNTATESGGAIYSNFETSLKITNCTFNNNTAKYNGGAIYTTGNNTLIKNNTFYYNNANNGGAISNGIGTFVNENNDICLTDNSTIIQNNFNNNQAVIGGAIYNYGVINTKINNNTFSKNHANNGGAIYNYANQVTAYTDTGREYIPVRNITIGKNMTINQNIFLNNQAVHNGGAIYNNLTNLTIYNSTLSNNIAGDNGGAIYSIGNNTTIQKNLFKQNKATQNGTVIINNGIGTINNNINAETTIYSNTIYNNGSNVKITNNTFDDGIINTKTTVSTVKGIIGEKLTLKATVVDNVNKKVNEGNLIFKLNGVTIKDNGKLTGSSNPLKVKVTNGVATTTIIPDLDMRNADKLTASYIGTDNYNASASNTTKIQVSQRNASIVVTTNVKTIKQGQVLTLTAKVYDTTNGKKSTNLAKYADEFVYFKVNGITLKDSKGQMLKVKVVNGTATTKYTIPLGLSGVTDGKTMTPKNHTIIAGFYNKNYQENIRNTSTFQVERSNITITISNATVNNKTHKLSLTATIKD